MGKRDAIEGYIIKKLVKLSQKQHFNSKIYRTDFIKNENYPQVLYNGYHRNNIILGEDGGYIVNAAIEHEGIVYGIPTGARSVLKVTCGGTKVELLGSLPCGNKKWTGGGEYKGAIYGFPRISNNLLKIDTSNDEISIIDIGCDYTKEHHYGGVICNGKIYQPPRNTNHILIIDLESMTSKRLYISKFPLGYRYCGSVFHPNGNIYFLPELGERVIELNPNTEKFRYIGKCIDSMTFSAGIAYDGNMYGFSAYRAGIMKIDLSNNSVEMIHEYIGCPGVYKNILFVNGKIYGLPGEGNYFWEYDPVTDEVKRLAEIDGYRDKEIKIACGCMLDNKIIGLPAKIKDLIIFEFELDNSGLGGVLNSQYFRNFY